MMCDGVRWCVVMCGVHDRSQDELLHDIARALPCSLHALQLLQVRSPLQCPPPTVHAPPAGACYHTCCPRGLGAARASERLLCTGADPPAARGAPGGAGARRRPAGRRCAAGAALPPPTPPHTGLQRCPRTHLRWGPAAHSSTPHQALQSVKLLTPVPASSPPQPMEGVAPPTEPQGKGGWGLVRHGTMLGAQLAVAAQEARERAVAAATAADQAEAEAAAAEAKVVVVSQHPCQH